jgi:pyruvate dehydrogenase (quinone)
MGGMVQLITVGRYRRELSDPRLVVLVLHNNDLNMVTREQPAMQGNP